MGVRADDGWSFICGLEILPHPAFPSSCLPVTRGKARLLYVKLNSYSYLDAHVPFEMCFCFDAILGADASVFWRGSVSFRQCSLIKEANTEKDCCN